MNPKTEALAFRIWAYAREQAWNCNASDIAEHLGEDASRVGRLLGVKGWAERLHASNRQRRAGRYKKVGGVSTYADRLDILDHLGRRE